jgi:hypothetical protein
MSLSRSYASRAAVICWLPFRNKRSSDAPRIQDTGEGRKGVGERMSEVR